MIKADMQIGQSLMQAAGYDEQKLKKALRGFESLFLLELLKSMRNTSFTGEDQALGLGKETFLSLADQALADHLSTKESLGIAKMLFEYFQRKGATTDRSEEEGEIKAKPIPLEPQEARRAGPMDLKKPASQPTKLQPLNPAQSGPLRLEGKDLPIQPTAGHQKQSEGKAVSGTSAAHKGSANAHNSQAGPEKVQQAIDRAAKELGVSKQLIEAMVKVESGGNPRALSPRGAKGLMQLVDTTAADMGVTNVYDVEQNIMGGAKYIKQLLDRFEGDLKLALAAYNAGPATVDKFGGVPPFVETVNYVSQVMQHVNKDKAGKASELPDRQGI